MTLRYYLFDAALPGDVTVLFDDHLMHAENFREHLDGFVALADEEFVIHGDVSGSVVTYANGEPRRMKDGIIWIIREADRPAFRKWIETTDWPSRKNESLREVRLPGRWFEPMEAAHFWLGMQGHVTKTDEELLAELARRGVPLNRFRKS
jgi:hypothetical protein